MKTDKNVSMVFDPARGGGYPVPIFEPAPSLRMKTITYQRNAPISLGQFINVLRKSGLAERRPVHNDEVMQAMLDHADVVVSAWDGEQLVGIATTLTDFHRVAYLADLAVHEDYHLKGIGKALIEQTRQALKPTCSIILLSAPKANEFYPHIGFAHNPRAWTLDGLAPS